MALAIPAKISVRRPLQLIGKELHALLGGR
jgi:hypothetical protein